MFLHLNHQKLEVYTVARQFVKECYFATNQFPADERYALTQQIKRAALSVHLNIAEGSSRKSDAERKRYYEIARGSIIEVDAALDIAFDLNYCTAGNLQSLGLTLVKCFKYLSGLINSTST
ncbi:four helix bundle protein [Mucilaginibacter ginsenosidivorans]|uniref:Four helix bundle protein n=1 Tax=Mucilaginibacter ginsenosidivorans TaxID=398053 RepID=A0A5B8URS1_9SPHI|nr:four helix bundle protein [Mucilaginibacter ginsenosidivorans]QEC61415.1 four helix bundle protein [Mucilaginibacter ginsenosidivorans]